MCFTGITGGELMLRYRVNQENRQHLTFTLRRLTLKAPQQWDCGVCDWDESRCVSYNINVQISIRKLSEYK